MKNVEMIQIPPSTNLIDVFASEYSFNSAVADLIDNALDGKATKVHVYFDTSKDTYSLRIEDNGNGLTKEKLGEAAVIGLKSSNDFREKTALGRYSTGLKSASNFLGENVVVASKTNKNINFLKIDFVELKKTKEWVAYFVDEPGFNVEKLNKENGTIVCCNNLKNIDSLKTLYEKIDNLKIYLNHVFGKLIINGSFELSIQTSSGKNEILRGWDPFSLPNNKSTKCVLTKIHSYKGKTIKFKIYILPSYEALNLEDKKYISGGSDNYGINKLQGFYIYRNKRLLSEAGWLLPDFDITDKTRYARIEVSIPSSLDKEFNVNLTKTKIIIPNDLESIFKNVAKKARTESNKNYNYKKHPESKPSLNKKADAIWVSVKTSNGNSVRLNKDNIVLRDLCKKMSDCEYNQLINLISKSLPVGMIASQNISNEDYSDQEILIMAKNLYEALKNQKFTKEEIHKKILQTEPFNHENRFGLIISLFDDLEVNADE